MLVGAGVLLQALCLVALVPLAGGPWVLGRPPLGRITALAVDGAGNVYLADADYIAIHVYRSDGTFARAVRSPIRPQDVHVATSGQIRVYDENGAIAVAESASDEFAVRGRIDPAELPARRSEAVGPDGATYRLEPPVPAASNVPQWYPKVVKVARGGDRQVIIADPLRRWLMRAPLPAAYFWLAAIFMFMTATDWSRAHVLRNSSRCVA